MLKQLIQLLVNQLVPKRAVSGVVWGGYYLW